MKYFCISLKIDKKSEKIISEYFTKDLDINIQNNYYHTTLFQGICNSIDNIRLHLSSYIEKGESKTMMNDLYLWDNIIKSPKEITECKYDNKYNSLSIVYDNSSIIKYYSKIIESFLRRNYLYISLSEFKKIKTAENKKSSIKFILNYQYMSRLGNITPHTTIGFNSKHNNYLEDINNTIFLKKLELLRHDQLIISELDDFCRTPYNKSIPIMNLREDIST